MIGINNPSVYLMFYVFPSSLGEYYKFKSSWNEMYQLLVRQGRITDYPVLTEYFRSALTHTERNAQASFDSLSVPYIHLPDLLPFSFPTVVKF